MFLFFMFLGVETFDPISAYRGHGLWILNDFCNAPANESKDLLELQELFEWNKELAESPSLTNLITEYKRAKEQTILEVKGFKLLLEDGSELAMDASMSSFGGGPKIPPALHGSLPMDKAMARLSNSLVSNIQSAVFRAAPGENKFDRSFYDLIAVFENLPGKRIYKTFVLDENDQKIAEFSTVPFQKRTLLVGIDPQKKEFGELTKAAKWAGKKSLLHHGTGRTVHYSETKTDFMTAQMREKAGEYRIITVWEDGENEPCWAIMTNQRQDSSAKILNTYMSYWPYLSERAQDDPVLVLTHENPEKEESGTFNNVSDICADFVDTLHGYCQRHFFPPTYSKTDINNLITGIYGIPGIFYGLEDEIIVTLEMDTGSVYRKDLEYAVKRVNERHILDHLGRRVWLEV